MLLVVISLFLFLSSARAEDPSDPYRSVRDVTLENGLKVYLNPNGDASQVFAAIHVQAGVNEESFRTRGVAHLTEHVLFRYGATGEKSHFDRLLAEGAEANGVTTDEMTFYFAALPHEKGEWLVRHLSGILEPRPIAEAALDKARKEIALEMEGISLLAAVFSSRGWFNEILESEFGIRNKSPLGLWARFNTRWLSVKAVEDYFDRFYHPKNLELYVVGRFEPDEMLGIIRDSFGKYASGNRLPRVEAVPKLREAPFTFASLTPTAPRVLLGTKLWRNEAVEEVVLRAYLDHLAVRLMKELRTDKVQTYAVSPFFTVDTRRFGFGFVTFDTQAEGYKATLARVEEMIRREAEHGELADEEIAAAKSLHLAKLRNQESGVKGLYELAQRYRFFTQTYGTAASPYQVADALTPTMFRDSLVKGFLPQRRIQVLQTPPWFFGGDVAVIGILSLVGAFLVARTVYRKGENEISLMAQSVPVRYGLVSKIYLTVGFTAAMLVVGIALNFVEAMQLEVPLLRSSVVLRQYFLGVFWGVVTWFLTISWFALWPKRLTLTKDRIILRSYAYRSWAFPRDAVDAAVACRLGRVPTPRLSRRLLLCHLSPWSDGLYLRFRGGRAFFLGLDDPASVAREIEMKEPVQAHPADSPSPAGSRL